MLGVAPSASRLCASRVAAIMAAEDESAMPAGESSGAESAAAAVLASDAAMTAAIENAAAMTESADENAAAMTESADEPLAPAPPPVNYLEESDLINTRWALTFTPRPDSWRGGNEEEQEFALLKDGSVRWAGGAGGTGVGGRWQLREEVLEVIRTTPLGLVTGRDYYMAIVQAQVTEDLQFEIVGITRSYNWLFPVAVVADWRAKRLPGRFAMSTDDDDDDDDDSKGGPGIGGAIDSSKFSFPRPSDFNL